MKLQKFTLFAFTCLFFFSTYAFEGIIEQTFTDAKTKEVKTFVWYIKKDQVRLDVLNSKGSMTILPDYKELSLILFGDKAGEDGRFLYYKTSLAKVDANIPKLRLLEKNESHYNGEEAMEVKVLGSEGLTIVQYINSIDINIQQMKTMFAESVEFEAVFLTGDSGFPLSSVLMTDSEATYTLKTNSIDKKSLSPSVFEIPSKYELFTGVK